MLSSIIGIFKWWNRREKEDFNLDWAIRDSLLDEMLPEFTESRSMLAGRNHKWEQKGQESIKDFYSFPQSRNCAEGGLLGKGMLAL